MPTKFKPCALIAASQTQRARAIVEKYISWSANNSNSCPERPQYIREYEVYDMVHARISAYVCVSISTPSYIARPASSVAFVVVNLWWHMNIKIEYVAVD